MSIFLTTALLTQISRGINESNRYCYHHPNRSISRPIQFLIPCCIVGSKVSVLKLNSTGCMFLYTQDAFYSHFIYKTRITDHGVINRPERNAVFIPNSDNSDDEDLCDEDKQIEFEDEVDVYDENVESPECEDDNESESEEVDAIQESGEDGISDEDETPTQEKRQKLTAEPCK